MENAIVTLAEYADCSELRLDGNIMHDTAHEFWHVARTAALRKVPVIIHFARPDAYIGAYALEMIRRFGRDYPETKIVIVGGTQVLDILHVTRFDTLWNVCETFEEARKHVASHASS